MLTFIISLVILIVGYFTYGKLVERIFGIDPQRPTPAMAHPDGVDYVPLPTWKVFLIQFLNIAGMGPIFGAIMGIMYGPAAFIWIVCGTVFAGAVHDFTSAMISLRSDGLSIPEVVGRELGVGIKQIMRVFTFALLVLIGAVFVVTPSEVIAGLTPDWFDVKLCAIIIFIYYILATMLPIDKLIGQIYPLFGAVLLFMALGLLCYMLFSGIEIPDGMADGLYNRRADAATNIHPVFPMLCISIACGAISGFHATQSPMMAKCYYIHRWLSAACRIHGQRSFCRHDGYRYLLCMAGQDWWTDCNPWGCGRTDFNRRHGAAQLPPNVVGGVPSAAAEDC
jgi:carbon starvation protein CstA